MLTRCPNCQTLYRIGVEQLEMADGQAHCCRCDQVFDAQKNLQEQPFSDLTALEENSTKPGPTFSAIDQDADLAYIANAYRLELKNIEASDTANIESEEESVPNETAEAQEFLDDTTASPSSEASGVEAALGEVEPEQQKLDTPYPEAATLSVEELLASPKKKRSPLAIFFGFIGYLTLLILIMGQLAWFQREKLLQYPQGYLLLEKLCTYVECNVPQPRDTSRIKIINRQVRSHPDKDGILLVQVVMVNQAPFPQPYPLLELSLSTTTEQLVARRSFKPEEYLHSAKDSAALMPPGTSQHVEMELVDPGDEVTGFEFDFL